MRTFPLRIGTPDGLLFEGEVQRIVCRSITGDLAILAGHCNTISAIAPGKLTYRVPGGSPQYAAVSAGLVKIENGEVLVLVDTAERPEDIDALRAKEAADAAREALLQKQSIQEYHMAQTTLARAIARLRVKDGMEQ